MGFAFTEDTPAYDRPRSSGSRQRATAGPWGSSGRRSGSWRVVAAPLPG